MKESSVLHDNYDQQWFQTCLRDLQEINERLRSTGMYYTSPNDFLKKASVADWREHEKNNSDRLIALDAQIAVQEKLTPIADDEEEDDDADEEEEKVATDAEMVDEPPAEMSVDAASPSGATSAKGDPNALICKCCATGPKKVPGYGVDPVELVCPDCSDRVHLSCVEICLVCEATVCVQCHADHVSGKCPKVPAIRAPAGAGGNAAPSTLMPACLDNNGKVTSVIERLALHSPYSPCVRRSTRQETGQTDAA